MNKKGFTLIEIIISITLIILVSIVTIVNINLSNKNTSELEQKLLESASVFIEVEKDENGKYYSQGINNGGRGVEIPISNLIDKGYYKKEDYIKLLDEKKLENKNYYIVALLSNEACESGEYYFKASWETDATKPVYICNVINTEKPEEDNTILGIIKKEFEDKGSTNCNPGLEYGICAIKGKDKTKDNKMVYYYIGEKQNNYIKIGNETFYIVRTTEDNGVKLVSIKNYEFSANLETDISYHYGQKLNDTPIFITSQDENDVIYDIDRTIGVVMNFSYGYCPKNFKMEGSFSEENKWDIENFYKCFNDKDEYIKINSLKYELFLNVKKWYDNLKIDNIDNYTKEHYWCDNSYYKNHIPELHTKCFSDNDLKYRFGLLSLDEYFLVAHGGYSENQLYNSYDRRQYYYFYNSVLSLSQIMELTYDFTINTHSLSSKHFGNAGWYLSRNKTHYRPSLVIRDDLIVESGDGSEDNPYIIKTL